MGYTIGQIPSNICMKLVGPSWLTIIMIGWGLVSALGCLIYTWQGYIIQRLFLGIIESGTFPGWGQTIFLFLYVLILEGLGSWGCVETCCFTAARPFRDAEPYSYASRPVLE